MKKRPSREQAEKAVETLLCWIGEDPAREGLKETPRRVLDALRDTTEGYHKNEEALFDSVFEECGAYEGMVLLKNIGFSSLCEHHLLPVIGQVHIAYFPHERVLGISKLARLVDLYAKRLQLQERFTVQIAQSLMRALKPQAVGVVVEAEHFCMTIRGIQKPGTIMHTAHFTGFLEQNDHPQRKEFLNAVKGRAKN